MMKKIIKISAVLLLVSCTGLKHKVLKDGISDVPIDCRVYRNVIKFDTTLLRLIDTNAIYESFNRYNHIVDRLDTDPYTNNLYFYIRFYSNGYINDGAIIPKDKMLETNDFNDSIRGRRGVFYRENDKIYMEEFGNISEVGFKMGKHKLELTFKGDTLVENGSTYYVKRPLPPEFLRNRVNWYCPELDTKKK